MSTVRSLFVKEWKELAFWILYNILLGTAFVWLAWFSLPYYRPPNLDVFENIRNGNLLVFTISLCSSSLGLYSQLTREYMLATRRLITWLFIVLIIGTSYVYAHSSAYRGSPNFYPVDFFWLSISLFFVGCGLSFWSYLLRLLFQSGFDLRQEEAQKVSELSKQAATHNEADGIKL